MTNPVIYRDRAGWVVLRELMDVDGISVCYTHQGFRTLEEALTYLRTFPGGKYNTQHHGAELEESPSGNSRN